MTRYDTLMTQLVAAGKNKLEANYFVPARYVVTAGGMGFIPIKSTEIWTVGSGNDFEAGPDLPSSNFIGASMAQSLDGKSLILSGGNFPGKPAQNLILQMTCAKKCEWKTLEIVLKESMFKHASMFIPANSFDCGAGAEADNSEGAENTSGTGGKKLAGSTQGCCDDMSKMMKEIENRCS